MTGLADLDLNEPQDPIEDLRHRIPLRPAWIEIDAGRLQRNFEIINAHRPPAVKFLSVVKDDGYGHGALTVARAAMRAGAVYLAVGLIEDGIRLREHGLDAPILVFGQRSEAELPWCVRHGLTCAVQDAPTVQALARAAAHAGRRVPVHLKLNTGMNRYGVRWTEAWPLVERILAEPALELEGVFSHFAMSDEADKSSPGCSSNGSRLSWRNSPPTGCRSDTGTSATAAACSICLRPTSTWCASGCCPWACIRRRSAAACPASSR